MMNLFYDMSYTLGVSEVSMKHRWSVQNHIKTVHAIAVCNLVEMAMGLIVEGESFVVLPCMPIFY